LRNVSLNHVLWVDPSINNSEENKLFANYFKNAFMKNRIDFSYALDVETGIFKAKNAVNTIMLASNGMAHTIL